MADDEAAGYDQRERFNDPEEASRMAQDAHQSQIWTALPVIIKKHDVDSNTAWVQPTTKLKHVDSAGKATWKDFPMLKDVPINYHGGGGATITAPIGDGDEGIVIFCSRDISKWWNQGGTQEQDSARMHDISDGWLIPGGRSQPRKLSNVSSRTWQLRTDDGTHYIDFDPVNKVLTMKSPNPVVVDAPSLKCTGEIIAKYNADNIHLTTHTHSQGNDTGGDGEVETNKPTNGT